MRVEWKEAGTEQADGPRTESYGIQPGEHMQKWKGTPRELQGATAGEATLGAGAPVRSRREDEQPLPPGPRGHI